MTEYFITLHDSRQAYLFIKAILSHKNSSFSQRYQAIQLLAIASNCTRHLQIERRGFVDILRTDVEMENQVKYVLYPNDIIDYRMRSFEDHVKYSLQINRLEDLLTLSNHLFSQYETLHPSDFSSLLQTYGIFYGRNGQFEDSKYYYEICVNSTSKKEPEILSCRHMLQHTTQQLENGLSAVIQELSHRIQASRTISAAKNNQQVVAILLRLLRKSSSSKASLPSNLLQSALTTIFECKKYLYYHGWIDHKEILKTMKSLVSKQIQAGDVYMTDTLRLLEQDYEFSQWRHNGSEYEFWKRRNEILPSQSSLSSLTSRPYILRLITNGMSAHNFGHCHHDILWPFIISYNLYHLFSGFPTSPIYVIDIGLFLLPFLRLAYPERTFIGFRSVEMVPIEGEEILISGLGAPKSFDENTIRKDEMKEVRRHMIEICRNVEMEKRDMIERKKNEECKNQEEEISKTHTEKAIDSLLSRSISTSHDGDILTILFVERNLTKTLKVANDERYEKDREEDHPSLRHYYDSGYWSHTALTSKRIIGSNRRNILNYEEMIGYFEENFSRKLQEEKKRISYQMKKRKKRNRLLEKNLIQIIRFNPEKYSYCEQILIASQANVIIGQHGAAMSLIGYMDPTEHGIVIELESILNQIFDFISNGSGLNYRAITMTEYEKKVYRTKDKHHITVNPEGLADIVMEMILRQEKKQN